MTARAGGDRGRCASGRDGSTGLAGVRTAGATWVVLAVAAAAVAGSCGGEGPRRSGDPSVEIRVGFSPTPPVTGEAGVRVTPRADGQPLGPATTVRVRVGTVDGAGSSGEGDGNAAGPTSLPWDTLTASDPGTWTGTVHFPAAGAGTVVVEVRTGDGREARFIRPVTVSAAPAGDGPRR